MNIKEKSDGASITTNSFQEVVKGTGIIFIVSLLVIIFTFAGRVLIARNYSQVEYGIFSLGITILSISLTIGTLGLQEGATRQIAYYQGKEDKKKLTSIILYSLLLGLFSGIIISILLFFSSDIISIRIFKLPELSFTLRVFAIAIPFYILILVLTAIYRGFRSLKEKIFFSDSLRNLLFVFFIVFVIWVGLSFKWAIIAYTISVILTSVLFICYFFRKKPVPHHILSKNTTELSVGKSLLLFSLPLLFVTFLNQIMNWTDTLMLGYYKTADIIGLYNAALPLGRVISMLLGSMIFIYMPVISGLHAKNQRFEMKRSYAILTKWLCTATLPLASVFVFFPTVVLNSLFGHEYILAGTVLQILAVGFLINNLMGPNGATLTAMGKTKFLMCSTFVAMCINITLNALLIPKYGIIGAAVATVTALILINIIRSIKLYSISKIHSLGKNILKPIILSSVLIYITHLVIKELFIIEFWMLPIFFFLFIILTGSSILFSKSVDKEDVDMLKNIEKRTGLNLKRLRRFIKKFI
jgi:O-antigen/teichoic acid export membrane protein